MATILSCHHQAISRRTCVAAIRCLQHQLIRQSFNTTANTSRFAHLPGHCKPLNTTVLLARLQQSNKFGHAYVMRTLSNSSLRSQRSGTFIPVIRCGNRVISVRFASSQGGPADTNKTDTLLYILSVLILSVGLAYAGVPFFKMFCRQFGLGGNPELSKGHDRSKVSTMKKVEDREITVRFNADIHAAMKWNFKPQQTKIKVKPGETALAFYTAENPTDKPIVGIATYTVTPYIAAPYFNKIQCFCFEEQILNPHEQVDMPVFFYIDPEYDEDPQLEFEDNITLSYTFFEAKEGMSLPLPGFMQGKPQSGPQPTGNVVS